MTVYSPFLHRCKDKRTGPTSKSTANGENKYLIQSFSLILYGGFFDGNPDTKSRAMSLGGPSQSHEIKISSA